MVKELINILLRDSPIDYMFLNILKETSKPSRAPSLSKFPVGGVLGGGDSAL